MKYLVLFFFLFLSLLISDPASCRDACNPPHAVFLIYHHVSNDTPSSTSVTPDVFDRHLEYLELNGFRILDLPSVVHKIKTGQDLPDSVVVLTFDDGYESVYSEVFPRLKKRGWPFTVFVCPDAIDQHEGPVLNWNQLREMQAGGATVASHGLHHGFMNRRRAQEDSLLHIQRLESELKEANNRLAEEHLTTHPLLAYPYGEYAPDVQGVIARLGWTAFGQQSGVVGPQSDFTRLPRFPMAAEFAALENFGIKISSLPMPMVNLMGVDPNLDPQEAAKSAPSLELVLNTTCLNADEVTAFASKQGAIACNWLDAEGGVLQIQAPNPLPPGRSRYNVTAPVPGTGRWYWFSQKWIIGTDHQY